MGCLANAERRCVICSGYACFGFVIYNDICDKLYVTVIGEVRCDDMLHM